MSRRLVVLVLAAMFLVAGAGLAEAKKKEEKPRPDLPERAKAHGLAKRAPEPAPEPSPTPAPEPARSSGTSRSRSIDRAPEPAPVAAQGTPIPPTHAERLDVMFAAPGAVAVAGPRLAPGIGVPGDSASGESGAPWWLALLWALPFVGIGGTGAVLLLRRREKAPTPPRRAMAPVEPADVSGLLHNGNAAVARGALDEAVTWFDAALRISPTLAVAHFCKGVCLAANGRVAEAYGALDEAVYAAPEEASYRVHFARVALALGKHHEAMDALALVAREMPELGPAMLDDPQLAGLRDHPRFLMMCGAL